MHGLASSTFFVLRELSFLLFTQRCPSSAARLTTQILRLHSTPYVEHTRALHRKAWWQAAFKALPRRAWQAVAELAAAGFARKMDKTDRRIVLHCIQE